MKRVVLLLTLSGCALPSLAPSVTHQSVSIPPELRAPCPVAPPGVDPPKPPRTFDSIIAWGQHAEQARADTFRALEACRARYARLIEWADREVR